MNPTPFYIRFLPHGLIVLTIIGAVLFIDHRGYVRARNDAERERLAYALITKQIVDTSTSRITDDVIKAHNAAGAEVREIQTINRTIIQPTLTREIQNAPDLGDPDRGITDGLLELINRTLDLGSDPTGTPGNALSQSVTIDLEGPGSGSGETAGSRNAAGRVLGEQARQ